MGYIDWANPFLTKSGTCKTLISRHHWHMIVPEHSANYSLAPRSKRCAGQVPEKSDEISRKKSLVTVTGQAVPAVPASHLR
jgi:hypothetical protein